MTSNNILFLEDLANELKDMRGALVCLDSSMDAPQGAPTTEHIQGTLRTIERGIDAVAMNIMGIVVEEHDRAKTGL